MRRCLLSFALIALVLNTTAQTIVKESGGNIMLLNNNVETVISDTKDATSPVIYGQKVYYLRTSNLNNKIVSYDIAGKQYNDILSPGMKAEGYTIKSEIVNMLADTKAGLLYLTAKDIYNGQPADLVWVYNISSGQYRIFSDGKLDSIDQEGNVTTIFESKDENGKFTRKAHFTSERKIIKIDDKVYQ